MKILFVFTGGTIGSTLGDDNVISTDPAKKYGIIRAYADKYTLDFDYDTADPYSELSENNTGAHIRMLSRCVKDNLCKDYDGIVVTHGTDTLQYSAVALGYALGCGSIPVCLVSANRPIEHELSNALDNLHAAICFIKTRAGRGVFVPYRNDNSDKVCVHRATRLLGAKAFSDEVSSVFEGIYGYFDEEFNFVKNDGYSESADDIEPFELSALGERSDSILVLFSYPGMVYPRLDKGVKYILLNSYHSGTVDTFSREAREFFDEAKERGICVYVTGVTGGPKYESASVFSELGIVPLKNISPVAAYVKLWILSQSVGIRTEKLFSSLGGDIVDQ